MISPESDEPRAAGGRRRAAGGEQTAVYDCTVLSLSENIGRDNS